MYSPRRIRTVVLSSKGSDDWPLHHGTSIGNSVTDRYRTYFWTSRSESDEIIPTSALR